MGNTDSFTVEFLLDAVPDLATTVMEDALAYIITDSMQINFKKDTLNVIKTDNGEVQLYRDDGEYVVRCVVNGRCHDCSIVPITQGVEVKVVQEKYKRLNDVKKLFKTIRKQSV